MNMRYPKGSMARVPGRIMINDDDLRNAISLINANQRQAAKDKRKKVGAFWDNLSTPQKVVLGGTAVLAFLATGGAIAAVAERKKSPDADSSYMFPEWIENNLSSKEIEELKQKRSKDELTDEEWGYMMDVSPEHAEEWLDRDENLREMSLEDYDELIDFSDYSGLDLDDIAEWK